MRDDNPRTSHTWTAAHWLVLALVVIAGIVFVARGPLRGLRNPSDFVLVYGPARTWLCGGNPYDLSEVDRQWMKAHGPANLAPSNRTESGLLYPPTTLIMFAPFAALTWPVAHYAWIGANVAFLAVILWCLARIAGFGWRQRRTWLLVAAALTFAPVHTTFHHGQTPLYVMMAGLLGFVFTSKWASGPLIALASAIKPQIGLPLLALEGVRARWGSVIIGIASLIVLSVIAIAPMAMHRIPWWDAWRANIMAMRHGGAGDPSSGNPNRHQLLQLQYPITALINDAKVAEIAAVAIIALLAVLFFLPAAQRMKQTTLLHALSTVSVLSLMVVYHRFYDAVLLLIVAAWAIDRLARRREDWLCWCALALLLPFFLNSATALVTLQQAGHVPAWLVNSPCWERLLLPHQAWALLFLAICMLVAQRHRGGQSVTSETAPSGPSASAFRRA